MLIIQFSATQLARHHASHVLLVITVRRTLPRTCCTHAQWDTTAHLVQHITHSFPAPRVTITLWKARMTSLTVWNVQRALTVKVSDFFSQNRHVKYMFQTWE